MNLLENVSSITSFSQVLHDLIGSNPEIIKDCIRLNGFLKDVFGSTYKKEIFLIIRAAKLDIINQLNDEIDGKPITAKLYDIMSKFILNGMLDEESAVWVTIVWAVTLQKIEAKEGQQVMENCRSILPELQKKRSPICISHDPISNLVTVNASPIDQIHKKGKCYHNQGNYDEAIRCYDRALSINPQDYNILSDKGLSLHNQGNYDEAIRCYDRALSINPQDEFVKRRRDNTIKRLEKKFEKTNSRSHPSANSPPSSFRRNLSKNYLVGIIVVTPGMIIGLAVLLGLSYDNPGINIPTGGFINDGENSTEKTNLPSADLNPIKPLDQQSISTFADSIKQQIVSNTSTGKGLSNNDTSIQNSRDYYTDIDETLQQRLNEAGDINYRLNEFKFELERAMESNFN